MSKRAWQPPADVKLETDPRFPSGKWIGFWMQGGAPGRQHMSLNLVFFEGRISGEGCDCVGDFIMSGQYELKTGGCRIIKSYVGAHDVFYEGRNEDDGLWIWGLWHLVGDRGGFHLWPAGEEDPTGRKLKAAKEQPAARRRVKLAPVGAE